MTALRAFTARLRGVCPTCGQRLPDHVAEPLVRDTQRCIVHDLTYTTVCSGCRADEIASA